jgi:quinol monooxygenase YgiN
VLEVMHQNYFMKTSASNSYLVKIILIVFTIISLNNTMYAQQDHQYIRIAKIIVDSAQLENYKTALKEGTAAAVNKEPGVLMLYAVYEKDNPTHVTVFEIYADKAAYESHIQTPHFKKYKSSVEHMVKSLELVDVVPIALEAKEKV